MHSVQADLHLHTTASDGQLPPAELIRLVHERGIPVAAVTDHDSIEGLHEAQQAGEALGIRIVPGVELSVTAGEEEVHLLGYFFDPGDAGLSQRLAQFRRNRYKRVVAMVERLKAAGAPVSLQNVEDQAVGGALGRPHVAAALVEAGHVATRQEAFERYLGAGGAAYVPGTRFAAEEALDALHEAGGIGVLAHPGQWTSSRTVQSLIRWDLDGIEAVHPAHTPWLQAYYRSIAQENGLIETGGSDFHGWRSQDLENLGRYTIAYEQVEAVRSAA